MTASRQPEANFIHRGANNYMSINNEEIINPCRPWKPLSGWIYSWSVNVLPVLLLVFAGVAVVTVIFFFLFGSKELISPRSYNNYSAERINVILGNKIDPCQDFGRSVCTRGGTGTAEVNQRLLSSTFDETARTVLHEIKLLLTDPSTSHKPKAIIMAKYLYNDCMHNSLYDSNDLEFLPFFTDDKPIIEWPITEEQWSQSEPSLERILALIFAHRGQSIFVVNLSEDDSSMFMLTLNLGVPVDLRNIGNQKIFAAVQALSNWKIDDPKTKMKKSVIIGEMREFENNFGKLFETVKCEVDELDIGEGNDGYYEEIALDYIHRQMSQINWTALVQHFFEILELEQHVSSEMSLYVHCFEFFKALDKLIGKTGRRTVSNSLILRFAAENMNQLDLQIWRGSSIARGSFEYKDELRHSRSDNCASIVIDGFGIALKYLHYQKYPMASAEKIIKEMFYYLKMAFRQIISNQAWIPEAGKDQVTNELIEKLMQMTQSIKINSQKDIMNDTIVDALYDGLKLNESSFILNVLKLKKFQVARLLMNVNEIFSESMGPGFKPFDVNAYYNRELNSIEIPADLLHYPMFHKDYPMYLNFANLGTILAHEMAHGFDNTSIYYYKDGNFNSSWPDDFQTAFGNQAICFVEQYEKFKVPHIDKFVDGYLTLDENICDNTALPLALLAYEMWAKDHDVHEPLLPQSNFTIEQIFFIATGQMECQTNQVISQMQAQDVHSPGPLRVKGVIQNSPNFGHIFGCPVGTPMNPTRKCSLWS